MLKKKLSLAMIGLTLLGSFAPLMASAAVVELAPTTISAQVENGDRPAPPQRPDGAPKGEHGGFRHGGPGPEGRGPRGEGPFGQLNLTDEQKQKLKAIHEKHRDEAKDEILKILTPEQAAKFEALIAEHKQHKEGKKRNYELKYVEDKEQK